MTLKHGTFSGDIIESEADPASDSTYVVSADTKWLDISQSPAVLYQRNASNTAWLRTDGSLGRYTESFTASAGQTTYTTLYTPAGISDFLINIDGWLQPIDNITNLSGKTLTFTALTAGMVVTFTYTRLD
jgi:hypothetical protein